MTINHKNMLAAALITMGTLTGCKKLLDVPPRDKVPQSTLFNSEQGFKDALTGVYLGMDKNATGGARYGLYTNDLTMGIVSAMGFDYDNANISGVNDGMITNAGYYYYNNAGLKVEMDGIWTGLYNNIANLNNILLQIDERKDEFTGDNYNRVKAEAIALRAYLHFDLARLYGKSPVTGMNDKAIPYIKQYQIKPTPFNTLQEVLDACVDDLTTAKDLFAQTDTSAVLKGTEDPFTSYTQNHLNYWAVQGLLARVNLYKGDLDNAARYAAAVIATNKFPLIATNVAALTNAVRDRTFSQELLFALYSTNIKNINASFYNLVSTSNPLQLSTARKSAIYVAGSGSTNDYRYNSWFDNNTASPAAVVPSKFFQDANLPYVLQNIVPLIRVSEMYYIAAECANRRNDIAAGVGYLNQVRQARGLNALNAAGINSTDSVANEITREYQKEFIQEGQTFYYYKRLNKNIKQVTGSSAPDETAAAAYQWPVPDQEKEYNNP